MSVLALVLALVSWPLFTKFLGPVPSILRGSWRGLKHMLSWGPEGAKGDIQRSAVSLKIRQDNVLQSLGWVAALENLERVVTAMRQHSSQYVWYRKLFVRFSRYSYENEYHRI